jgi:hypothetical protein
MPKNGERPLVLFPLLLFNAYKPQNQDFFFFFFFLKKEPSHRTLKKIPKKKNC